MRIPKPKLYKEKNYKNEHLIGVGWNSSAGKCRGQYKLEILSLAYIHRPPKQARNSCKVKLGVLFIEPTVPDRSNSLALLRSWVQLPPSPLYIL
jgi:hypothetical protein